MPARTRFGSTSSATEKRFRNCLTASDLRCGRVLPSTLISRFGLVESRMHLLVHLMTEAVRVRFAQTSGSEAFPVLTTRPLESASPVSRLAASVGLALQLVQTPETLAPEHSREFPVFQSIHLPGLVQPTRDIYQA